MGHEHRIMKQKCEFPKTKGTKSKDQPKWLQTKVGPQNPCGTHTRDAISIPTWAGLIGCCI